MKNYDAVVIGGGPAGMTAALYLARFGRTVAMVEKVAPGGLMLQTAEIENYPGVPNIQGYALSDAMLAQLSVYEYDRYGDEVTAFEHAPGANKLKIGSEWIQACSVIIATGVQYRKLGLPREDEFLGKGISHCALCDGNFFRGQVVGVVGGGNSALEESLFLSRIVKELHLFHRRDAFRAARVYHEKVRSAPNIHLHMSSVLTELVGEGALSGVRYKSVADESEFSLDMDGLFIFTGFEPASGILPKELKVDGAGFVVTDVEMRCNLPGIFAAGDIRSKDCRQIITAAGDGATAAHAANAYLEQQDA